MQVYDIRKYKKWKRKRDTRLSNESAPRSLRRCFIAINLATGCLKAARPQRDLAGALLHENGASVRCVHKSENKVLQVRGTLLRAQPKHTCTSSPPSHITLIAATNNTGSTDLQMIGGQLARGGCKAKTRRSMSRAQCCKLQNTQTRTGCRLNTNGGSASPGVQSAMQAASSALPAGCSLQ